MNKAPLLCLLFLWPSLTMQGQYKLPTAEVLVANQIQKIKVEWVTLPSLSPKGQVLDNTTSFGKNFWYKTYFINSIGKVDSIHRLNAEWEVFEKALFTYDAQQRLIRLATISADGQEKSLQTVCKTPEGDWHYQSWQQGQLEWEIISRSDSLVERKIYHRQDAYCVEAYDFEQEISTRTWFNDGRVVSHESYSWITQAEKPQKIIYHEYIIEDGRKKTYDKEYPLQADGSLVGHETKWLGTDINWFVNYFERIEHFRGIQHSSWTFFEEDTLLTKSPIVEMLNYDGTKHRHYYTFEYE